MSLVVKKDDVESQETIEDTQQSSEPESRLVVHTVVLSYFSGKLSPDCPEPSIAIEDLDHLRVLNCCQPVFFRDLGTGEKYEHVVFLVSGRLIH